MSHLSMPPFTDSSSLFLTLDFSFLHLEPQQSLVSALNVFFFWVPLLHFMNNPTYLQFMCLTMETA